MECRTGFSDKNLCLGSEKPRNTAGFDSLLPVEDKQ
nr:MAG TPA: S-Ribosylhomocysteinase (LuxS) [Caudoviricetes sp.]